MEKSQKCNLVGLKSRLSDIKEMNLGLETPLVWELPPFFTDEMIKWDLERVIHSKTTEINDSSFEKVEIFFLEVTIEYFMKTLLERQNLEARFQEMHRLIDTVTVEQLGEDAVLLLREDLHYMVYSTECVVEILKSGEPSPLPTPRRECHTNFSGVQGWFNMVVYNYQMAFLLFESISQTPEYRPLFAFYHGKAMARQRRERNDWAVPEREIKLLLEASHRHTTLPCILQSFENAGSDSAVLFKYRSQFNEILRRAWESRDAYHSINLTRLASLFLRRKEVDRAREIFELAMKLNPKCSVTLHKYGSFLYITEQRREAGIDLMLQANHVPAFLSAVKLATKDDVFTIPALFDKVELILTNLPICPGIRYIMFVYSLENRNMAKATHHLKALYDGFKTVKFAVGKSKDAITSITRLFSLRPTIISEEVDIMKECSRFRKICKEFDDWIIQRESVEDEYEVFSIPS